MEFEYLDLETESLLKSLQVADVNSVFVGEAMEYLVKKDYVHALPTTTLSDLSPRYNFIRLTQKGISYFEMKAKYEKEQKKLSRREWIIALGSAFVGAIIGLIPSFLNVMK